MDDDRDVAGHLLEAVLEPQPQFLHPVQRALGEGGVAAVMARGEAQRFGLDPGHLRQPPAHPASWSHHCTACRSLRPLMLLGQVALDQDGLGCAAQTD